MRNEEVRSEESGSEEMRNEGIGGGLFQGVWVAIELIVAGMQGII